MVHSDVFRRMWSTTFRGAIECQHMFITDITFDNTIRYNVKSLASRCFFITSNIRFLNTPVYLQTFKDMPYSLNCISVLLFTQSVYFVRTVVMGVTSLSVFHSTVDTRYLDIPGTLQKCTSF